MDKKIDDRYLMRKFPPKFRKTSQDIYGRKTNLKRNSFIPKVLILNTQGLPVHTYSPFGSIVLAFGISSAWLFANKDRGSFWRCENTLFGSAVLSRWRRDLRLQKGTYIAKDHNSNLIFNSSIDIDLLCSPAFIRWIFFYILFIDIIKEV